MTKEESNVIDALLKIIDYCDKHECHQCIFGKDYGDTYCKLHECPYNWSIPYETKQKGQEENG